MTNGSEKAYAEFAGADHFASGATGRTALTSRFTVSWFKRFIDNDTRYDQFLCPRPVRSDLVEYRDTCPHGSGTPTTTTTAPPGSTTTTRPATTTTHRAARVPVVGLVVLALRLIGTVAAG